MNIVYFCLIKQRVLIKQKFGRKLERICIKYILILNKIGIKIILKCTDYSIDTVRKHFEQEVKNQKENQINFDQESQKYIKIKFHTVSFYFQNACTCCEMKASLQCCASHVPEHYKFACLHKVYFLFAERHFSQFHFPILVLINISMPQKTSDYYDSCRVTHDIWQKKICNKIQNS